MTDKDAYLMTLRAELAVAERCFDLLLPLSTAKETRVAERIMMDIIEPVKAKLALLSTPSMMPEADDDEPTQEFPPFVVSSNFEVTKEDYDD